MYLRSYVSLLREKDTQSGVGARCGALSLLAEYDHRHQRHEQRLSYLSLT